MSGLTETQHAQRLTGIGGSDAGVILGVSPFKTSYQLYLEKRQEIDREAAAPSGTEAGRRWGTSLEQVIADAFTEETGYEVRNEHKLFRHKELDFAIANIDRRVLKHPAGRAILEAKSASHFDQHNWGETGTDEVPGYIYCQAQHYLAVLDAALIIVACLIGGRDFRIYPIEPSEDFQAELLDAEELFWDRVVSGVPPEPDFEHRTTPRLLREMYPGTDGSVIHLPDSALHWKEVMQDAAEQEKQYGAVKQTARNHIQHMMGAAAVGVLPDGTCFTRKTVKRKGYEVQDTEYTDFRFSKKLPKAAQEASDE